MAFVNTDIEKEYNRLTDLYPNVPGQTHPLLNMSDVLRAYFSLADYFSDPTSEAVETMLVGLRSADLLYSALSRQTVSFDGKTKYTNPIDICSTLFFGMVKNHSFSDGNKRTALLSLLYQLNLYGYYPSCSVNNYEKLVVAVAANKLPDTFRDAWKKFKKTDDPEIQAISFLLRKMTKRKDHSYHLKITAKDLVQSLENNGVQCYAENGKLHFQRIIPSGFFKKERRLNYTMVFGGWTRSVGAQTARDVLTSMELYDQFPDYQSFIDGQEPYYSLIQDFEGPLRRLKDE
ncbi:MAG: Fic family protein [Oscillospiraceae bacterium]|nr:Fic family protein [Oscillospiraceae bacterium]